MEELGAIHSLPLQVDSSEIDAFYLFSISSLKHVITGQQIAGCET